MDKAEQPTITQAIDVFAERKAFEAWWANWVPDGTMPSVTSHIFDAWLASARHRTTSLAAQDGLVEALDDATIDEIILNFAGGVVQVPSEHNPRGYVSYYRPREAMRKALSAIKEQHHD
jgi:hypothetical protein